MLRVNMRGMIDSSCGNCFQGMSCLLWLIFPFMEFSVSGENNLKIFPTSFSSLFHLRCYSQVTSISYVHFRSICLSNFTQMSSLNRYEKVTCENFGTQTTSLSLRVTRSDVQLERCIIPNVPISPQNYKVIWIIVLPENTVFQDFHKHTIVKYVAQNFPAFMLYVNTKTLNIDHIWDSERAILMWRIEWKRLTIKVWEMNWNLANTFWQIWKWRMEDREPSILPCYPSTCLCSTINWNMYSKNWNVPQKLKLHFWIRSGKHWGWNVEILLRSREQCYYGEVETCLYTSWYD